MFAQNKQYEDCMNCLKINDQQTNVYIIYDAQFLGLGQQLLHDLSSVKNKKIISYF